MAHLIFSLFTIVLLSCACQGNNDTLGRAARLGGDNRYYVYTRDDPRNALRVDPTVASANLIRAWRAKSVIVIHDVQGSFLTSLSPTLKDAVLSSEDVNVIAADWSGVASRDYQFAVAAVPQIGDGIANLIRVLVNARKISLENLHLVGFGVGAHIAAYAARAFIATKVARITALDPAGNLGSSNIERLRASDAGYVEVIHTDSGNTGISEAIGHVDFYPNGGIAQTGCDGVDNQCNHNRAWELFAASLTHGSLDGNKCPAGSAPSDVNCKGYSLPMGNNQLNKYGDGSYYVDAGDKYPYYNEVSCVTACLN